MNMAFRLITRLDDLVYDTSTTPQRALRDAGIELAKDLGSEALGRLAGVNGLGLLALGAGAVHDLVEYDQVENTRAVSNAIRGFFLTNYRSGDFDAETTLRLEWSDPFGQLGGTLYIGQHKVTSVLPPNIWWWNTEIDHLRAQYQIETSRLAPKWYRTVFPTLWLRRASQVWEWLLWDDAAVFSTVGDSL